MVQSVIEDCLRGLGYELVELEWHAGGQLRVYIEHAIEHAIEPAGNEAVSEGPIPEDGSGIRIEDCERVSHQLSHLLTVEGVDYSRLEVSSPGLDRPLRGRRDFERFTGSEITLKLKFAVAGRRNFGGVLMAGEEGRFVLEVPQRPDSAQVGKKIGGKGDGKVAVKSKTGSHRNSSGQAKQGAQAPMTLTFALDEIERARLVPKFKF